MSPNLKLKGLIIETFGSQCAAAQALGMDAPRLSRIVRGWETLRDQDRDVFLKAFGASALRRVLPKKGVSGPEERDLP